jgi:ribose transport system ATP-binding protein
VSSKTVTDSGGRVVVKVCPAPVTPVVLGTVRMRLVEQPIGSLSGGNQQRAIFGRAFAAEPHLLLLDEPTRGVDVGAKAEIYKLIDRAAEQGMGIVVTSSELEELLWICHRVAVMNHGRVATVIDRADATKERIMTSAAGTAPETHQVTSGATAWARRPRSPGTRSRRRPVRP